MTNTPRDRIAVAVARELTRQARDSGEYQTRDCYKVADAVLAELHPERRCELCGRTGTQQFNPTHTGWVCRSIYACNRRAK